MQIRTIHIVLFLITLITTFSAGYLQGGNIMNGIFFSAALIFILGTHEMGHYIYGRRNGVDITPPYFIPAPPFISPIGTFGAFIKIKSPISTKKALFDIGIAGPLAGIVAAIPVIIIGIKLSRVVEVTDESLEHGITLGSPLLFSFISDSLLGKIPEGYDLLLHPAAFVTEGSAYRITLSRGYDLLLHPVAFAGWVGLFVTSLNLMPAGQLDGGHIIYSILSRKWHRRISILIIVFLIIFWVGTKPILDYLMPLFEVDKIGAYEELLRFEGWNGWVMWAAILTIMGTNHPPTIYDEIELDRNRVLLGLLSLLVFLGCFTPMPIKV